MGAVGPKPTWWQETALREEYMSLDDARPSSSAFFSGVEGESDASRSPAAAMLGLLLSQEQYLGIETMEGGRANQSGDASNSIFSGVQLPVTLNWQDVVYKVKVDRGEKVILKGVSGCVQPGELLAMLGPSGSGKTTLLTLLGGRVAPTSRLTGSITYNGKPFSSSLKRTLGFVTQDDVLYAHLTVMETLYYTALLRLPGTLSRREKAAQAEAVLDQLGLTVCRNNIIGSALVRGISGGERKRVSIGQEMLINPSLLLLDEPTSGLDSTIAARIVSLLWKLTQTGGRTVAMTIHQPSSRLFYMFHKVLLLSDGNPVYFGKGSDALDYFNRIGYSPEMAMNPSDFLLDLANGVSANEETLEEKAATKQVLVEAYRVHLHPLVSEELTTLSKQFKEQGSEQSTRKMKQEWSTSWWEQFEILLRRSLKERRHEAFSKMHLIQIFVVAIVVGVLWFKSSDNITDQVGLLYFVNSFWGFYPAFQGIYTFPMERTMLTKERSSGMYRLSSYFMALTAGDLPMELVLPTCYVLIIYWMCGLKSEAGHFFMLLSSILFTVLVAQGVGLAIGAVLMDLKKAITLCSIFMLIFMLAGGFFVQNMPSFISWIKYISFNFYSFRLQLLSQFSQHDTYECGQETRCLVADIPSVKVVGLSDAWLAVVVMFVLLVFYRLVAYVALMRIGPGKK
ncbi:hypothetical protein ZIOFF_046322 [Zingiber officinale]|uniref:ABC transporter domain-containing protein n=1 Tax=Zingiber officinale TaxID=94328 RepID=A0A8J5G9G6_ZINOF|nr:hypothetical protein ZIOFF_046322 [Zingiber officinale]